MNVNALSKRTSSTTSSVCAKSSSVSPGNPTMMSVPSARSGIADPQALHEAEVALPIVGPAHALEDARRARLERKMRVLADAPTLGHGRDHRLAEVLRMRAREADALDPVHVVARTQKLAEVRTERRREVAAPRVHVLTEERDLLDAVAREGLDLGDDLARPPALLAAADRRDDAIRAHGVAAHRDLHPRLEAPLAMERQLRGEVLVCAELPARHGVPAGGDPLAEVRDRARAEGDVDERVALEDALALRLRVAAADRDDEVRALALARSRIPEVGREPRVRLLAHGAGVEDDDVRGLGRGRLPQSERLEHALDPLGVVRVHLAAERRDVVAPHEARIVARPVSGPSRRGRGGRARSPTRRAARRPGPRRRSGEARFRRSTPPSRPFPS